MNSFISALKIITIFKNIISDKVVSFFIDTILSVNDNDFDKFLNSYSNFISLLYENEENQNIYKYIKKLIYKDENIISKNCNHSIDYKLENIAAFELSLFDELLLNRFENLKQTALKNFSSHSDIIEHLPFFNNDKIKNFNLENIISSYKNNGYGEFVYNSAFKFDENKKIIPIKNFDAMNFSELKNYEYQKNIILNNTKAFIEGKEANNILLYGDRGCGKSSTVKALINEFHNLKIIQISKDSLLYLSELYEKIQNLPLKFIIFADDISFEENDKNFSVIKAELEGALSKKARNAIIYATTNRIHLVKENFSNREGNEIHYNDTVDEMVSLSDRFGITLTYSLLTKNEYIDIIQKIARDYNIKIDENLIKKAEEFAILKTIRTPRTAHQFLISYIAKINV